MRKNLPVTTIEHVLGNDDIIVSKTDLKGKITYVNQAFVRISGFTEEELLGAPHNIVRHPDMPPEAYRDLWDTLQRGKAWSGIVKNRCKNGDFYWVYANAAPTIKDGKIVGYTSVRTKPPAESVHAASALYKQMNQPETGISLREGRVASRGLFRLVDAWRDASLQSKLVGLSLVLTLLFLAPLLRAWQAGAGLDPVMLVTALIGVAAALSIPLWLHTSLLAPLGLIRSEMDKMSSGNLTGQIPAGQGEVATLLHALRILQTNVKLLVGQIKEASHIVHQRAEEIAGGNNDLSARTENQSSALQETASSMEELSSTVRNNADNATGATERMKNATQIAIASGDSMQSVVQSMDMIKTRSSRILDIIGAIDGIAFQTNILALNASVEAARAGENGRGFAVVAHEVRNLAGRSAQAAKEIKTMISDTVAQIEEGGAAVDAASAAIQELVSAVHDAAEIIADIGQATREQSAGIEQVSLAVNEMEQVTEQNASLVESAADCAKTLHAQANNLVGLVETFRLVPTR
ncbi:MAG TPA: methyl-accepting chemotaxis protein [Noviherbaspirillum sp.]|uniref:methyl-accepting chemotaxis protein n=1 Tax=Noviherbaspirillum sp. TaxID=1926288 RepID=UPI002D3121A6|nr:methyl-accepting chemotaxis protein [Noviherbaspirillum sp.]HYD94562.1 methyl-accepting chemotaxis protein [Noviherbaspirillum sp.]